MREAAQSARATARAAAGAADSDGPLAACPKCACAFPADAPEPAACPGCGLVLAKWRKYHDGGGRSSTARPGPGAAGAAGADRDPAEAPAWPARARAYLLDLPVAKDPGLALLGRGLLLAFFVLWTPALLTLDLGLDDPEALPSSFWFWHRVDLVFHEAGHVLFRPFGEFLTTLGGSLNQLLMPAIAGGVLLVRTRDPFGAALCLWWLGQSLVDLAPYINDARALKMQLVGGGTGLDRPGVHDWENILLDLHLIHRDHAIASTAKGLGGLLILLGLAWAGFLLYGTFRQWRAAR